MPAWAQELGLVLVLVWALVAAVVVAVLALFEMSSFSFSLRFSFFWYSSYPLVLAALMFFWRMAAVEDVWDLPLVLVAVMFFLVMVEVEEVWEMAQKISHLEVGLLFHSFQPTQQAIQTSRTDNLSLAIASEMSPFPQRLCPRSSRK